MKQSFRWRLTGIFLINPINDKIMVRHFETRLDAEEFLNKTRHLRRSERIFKKVKGMKNRKAKPFVVCSEIEWLNLE